MQINFHSWKNDVTEYKWKSFREFFSEKDLKNMFEDIAYLCELEKMIIENGCDFKLSSEDELELYQIIFSNFVDEMYSLVIEIMREGDVEEITYERVELVEAFKKIKALYEFN